MSAPTKLIRKILILLNKLVWEGTLPNTFCEAIITMILKPDKDTKEKKTAVSLMNTDAKTLNKILANRTQEHNENSRHGGVQVQCL